MVGGEDSKVYFFGTHRDIYNAVCWLSSFAKAALVRNYLEVYWPCAGELWAGNAIGTQLRDPINTGLTRWRMAVLNI